MNPRPSIPVACAAAAALTGALALAGCSSAPRAAQSACTVPPASSTAVNPPTAAPAAQALAQPGPAVASAWSQPGGNLASTRDVVSPITSANVHSLGVAWTVPVGSADDAYVATPVVANGVVYTQDTESNVIAIQLATGKVLWRRDYNSLDGGPNGVSVAGGVVYAATATAAVALQASTGRQLWRRTLIQGDTEEFNMAPGYDDGTVYLSTSPVSSHVEYGPGAKGILYALDPATGSVKWTWDEVQNLWGNASVNSGGGLWYPPSFDAQGNLYLGIANPGPISGTKQYPWGTSRPGPDLYTDAVVKLSPQGRMRWYYQLTPHDVHDWDLQNPPVLTTAGGQPVVLDGGKAGILVELSAETGKLLWQRPLGVHNGHDNDGLRTEHAKPGSHLPLPAEVCVAPGYYGGIETQLASNGSTTFAAVNNLPVAYQGVAGPMYPGKPAQEIREALAAVLHATGELVAVNQDSGAIEWDDKLPSSPYGAATVTNDVVLTTTFGGNLYAFDTVNGALLLKTSLSADSNAPLIVDGDYVIAGAGVPGRSHGSLIIAYKLGATGKVS